MVKASPVRFECKYFSSLRLPGNPPMGSVDVVIGRVVGVHIDEGVLTDGKVDVGKIRPIARCGYHEYAVVQRDAVFEMIIPGDPKQLVGLEGNVERARDLGRKQAPASNDDDVLVDGSKNSRPKILPFRMSREPSRSTPRRISAATVKRKCRSFLDTSLTDTISLPLKGEFLSKSLNVVACGCGRTGAFGRDSLKF